jgi:hypothetical protein
VNVAVNGGDGDVDVVVLDPMIEVVTESVIDLYTS